MKGRNKEWVKFWTCFMQESCTPADSVIQGCEEYDEMCRESLKEMERFTERLDEDMRAEFDTLMEHYLELTFMEKSHTFSHGFRLGAGIMCEVFCENGRDQA